MKLQHTKTRRVLAATTLGATLLFAGSVSAQTADPLGLNPIDTDPTKDQIVLDVGDGYSDAEVKRVAAECGLDVRLNSVYSDPANLYIADVGEGTVPAYLECLQAKAPAEWLEAGEENFEMALFGEGDFVPTDGPDDTADAPNDPLYQFQWNFKQINVANAWSKSTGKDVVVSVIDTGVAVEDDPNRNIKAAKDLKGTATVGGYDFVDDDAFAWDGHGHGTHVAGTIAQTTNNKYGVAGVAYNAKIMPLRVLNSRGFGQVSDIADAIRFSADNGANVINMSLGGPLPSLVMKRAIDYANKKNVTIIAAAGNGGKRAPSYPAAYNHVFAVAATQYDKSTTFYSQWGDYVDIAAPGGNTRVDQNGDGRPDGVMQETLKNGKTDDHDFLLYMGTSMAAPHVAGVAALVIAQGVTNPEKVEKILASTTDDSQSDRYSDKEYKERYGSGIVQADLAATKAMTEQGSWRLGMTFLLGLLAFGRLRRKDALGVAAKPNGLFVGGAIVASSGLFILPMLFGDAGLVGSVVNVIGRPLAELDAAILGFGWHQTPIMASALIPLGAAGLMAGLKRGKHIAAGVAIGMAGFLFAETFLMTSDVLWVPGNAGILDQAWLAVNGALSLAIGYLTLKRS